MTEFSETEFARWAPNCLGFFTLGLGIGTGLVWLLLATFVFCGVPICLHCARWWKARAIQEARRQAFREHYGSEPW